MPQFLLEAGFGSKAAEERAGMVGVTQPRRVAAVSAASRVAIEVNAPLGGLVGYQAWVSVLFSARLDCCSAAAFLAGRFGTTGRQAQGQRSSS